jgi:microsomal dipeptidase-like Zn-dependent dipeptidase
MAVAAAIVAAPAALLVAAGAAGASGGQIADRFEPANRCLAIASGSDYVAPAPTGYRVVAERTAAGRFFFEPTGLGRYLIYDADRRLLAAGGGDRVEPAAAPGRPAEWALHRAPRGSFRIASVSRAGRLAVGRSRELVRSAAAHGIAARFRLVPARGCARYPDPSPGARGEPARSVNRDGTVRGFVDSHLHITADMRAGGRVIDGKAFDRYGITRALGRDARNHGSDGSADVTGNLLRSGLPFGTHDTHGWPSFVGWPVHDTNTHQQTYFRWLERMWMAGERIVVAQTIEDEPLCRIEPLRAHTCNEERAIALEVRRLQALERYVDAQSGGPGKGWFRIVYGPRQARRVVERGRLAVVIGAEWSNPLGCSEDAGCTREDVDRGIARLRELGVRSTFIAHWVNNGFAGAALEGGTKGTFINVFNAVQNGSYLRAGPCPHPSQGEEVNTLSPVEMQVLSSFFPATAGLAPMPDYPPGRQCNRKGLTKLGAYFVRRLIANHMLIEVDHMSERARERVLTIATRHDYPLVSSHTGTGGSWTGGELRDLYRTGGFASATPADASDLAAKILRFRHFRDRGRYFGVGLGTDTGGFSSLPGPSPQNRVDYPFRGYRSDVVFRRQRTGERRFDLNEDGVAHYGLFADLLNAVEHQPDGRAAVRNLFRSAEAYLRTWELTGRSG